MIVSWPGGAKVAVMITAVIELWSEDRWPAYAPMAIAWPLPGAVDSHSISWSRYGVTTGGWRLLDLLERRGVTATFGINGLVAQRHPDLVRAAAEAGHEIAGHAWTQDGVLATMDRDTEQVTIERCTQVLGDVAGRLPRGWMSPRATPSAHTADLLTEAGYLWSGDHNDVELPSVIETANGPLIGLMHSEYSDIRGAMAGPSAYRDVHRDLLDALLTQPGPGLLNVTVHAHVGGRPLMSGMFDAILEHVQRAGDAVVFLTHEQVAEHRLRSHRSGGGRSHG